MMKGSTLANRAVPLVAALALVTAGLIPAGWAVAEDGAVAKTQVAESTAKVEAADATDLVGVGDEPTSLGKPAKVEPSSVATGSVLPAKDLEDEDSPELKQESGLEEVAAVDPDAPQLLLDASTWHSPDHADTRSGIGTEYWHDEQYARISGNLYAWSHLNDNQVSKYLEVKDFDFNIPAEATVQGIEVQIERRSSDVTHMAPLRDYVVKLVKNGSIVGDNRATGTDYPGEDTVENHGGPADLWGSSWTPADINGHNFGAVLAVKKYGHLGGHVYALVDQVRIRVTYSVNQAPEAFPRYIVMVKNIPLGNTLMGRDRDSEPLTFEVLDDVDHGEFVLADHVTSTHWLSWIWGSYRPDVNFVGTDVLTYRVTDPHGASSTSTATFVIEDRPFAFTVDGVTATPPAGSYEGTQLVTLTANTSTTPWGEVEIWYTKDGSEPACGVGTMYSSETIGVPVDLTIRAVACYPFGYSSEVSDFPYVITEPPTPPSGGGGGGGAPLPGGPAFIQQVYEPTPLPAVLGASIVNPVVARVLGAATCISKLNDPMGVVRPDGNLAKRLAGRILLKVQACGEAWYLNPVTLKRHQLPADETVVQVVRSLALKVSQEQLAKVTVGKVDGPKGSAAVAAELRGRFLEAPDGGLWYVNPADGRRYDVSTYQLMLQVMRKLGYGITNLNAAKLPVAE